LVCGTFSVTAGGFAADVDPTAGASRLPHLSASPDALNFPTQVVLGGAATSGQKTLTLLNPPSSSGPITINSISSSDPEFSPAQNCANMMLAAGATCNVNVMFTPAAAGHRSAKLTITDSGSPASLTILMRGAGRQGQLTVSQRTLSFSAAVGSNTSASVTLTNSNPIQMTLGTASLRQGSGPGFSLATSSQPCGSTLAANGGTCQVEVVFSPAKTGSQSGAVEINDDAAASPQKVVLKGTGKKSSGKGPSQVGLGAAIATALNREFSGFVSVDPRTITQLAQGLGSLSASALASSLHHEQIAMAEGGMILHGLAMAKLVTQAAQPIPAIPCPGGGTVTFAVGTNSFTADFAACVDQTTGADGSTTTITSNGSITFSVASSTTESCSSGPMKLDSLTYTFSQGYTDEVAVANSAGQPQSDITSTLNGLIVAFTPQFDTTACSVQGFQLSVQGSEASTDHLNPANDSTITYSSSTPFTLSLSFVNGGVDVSFSGTVMFVTPCQSGTLTIVTVQPLFFAPLSSGKGFQLGPSAGELQLTNSANGQVTTITVGANGVWMINGQPYQPGELPVSCS
jgi:hypothetical protein